MICGKVSFCIVAIRMIHFDIKIFNFVNLINSCANIFPRLRFAKTAFSLDTILKDNLCLQSFF